MGLEIQEQYQIRISNRRRVLWDFENNAAVGGGWEDVRENTIIGDNFNYALFKPSLNVAWMCACGILFISKEQRLLVLKNTAYLSSFIRLTAVVFLVSDSFYTKSHHL